MVNEDIVTALRNAVDKGEPLESAAKIMINSGYNPREIHEASQFIGGGIMLGIGIVLIIIFTTLIKKAKQPKTTKKLDFNKPKSFLGLISIPAGIIFIVNGIIYRAEGTKWFWAGVNTATEWYLTESSRWFTHSMIMFIIGIVLVCGGAFLLVMQYRKG